MQTFYISNSLLGDELAIAQQLISDILTCFVADLWDRAPLAAEAPHRGTSCHPYGGGKRCHIVAPHRGRSLSPY